MGKRISKDDYYLGIAFAVSKRSNCIKRHYGCIIVNQDEIVATGYNGSPRGEENCCEKGFCARLHEAHNSGDYSNCFSVHAEQNAMLSASRKEMIGATLYLAGEEFVGEENGEFCYRPLGECEPCPICMRMIKNAGIARVVGKKE